MIPIKDKDGHTVAEIDEELFPLRIPLSMKSGDKEYILRVFYEEDGKTPRSALLNTKK